MPYYKSTKEIYRQHTMAMYTSNDTYHRDGHRLGNFNKKTSIGDGKRKKGSFKRKGKKAYRGQGK